MNQNKTLSKSLKLIKILLIILGGIFALYGALVVAIIGTGHWFNYIFIVFGIGLIAVGILLEYILRINSYVLAAIGLIILLCLTNFAIFECHAISMSVHGQSSDMQGDFEPEWIIVLGAKIDADGSPKLELARRLQRAEEICTKDNKLILTGGQGSDEVTSEAEGSLNYLQSRGKISAKEILLETESTSTSENLRNALAIIEEQGGGADDSILIISSDFHLYRASKIALAVGLSNTEYAGATGLKILWPFYFTREYAAYIKEY